MDNRTRLGVVLALILLLAIPALSQSAGIISGRVTDPSGAVVPGAQITVTQTETNVDTPSETNNEGLFRVPGLRVGPYKVTVAADGFKKATRDGLSLRVGENLSVDMKLEVGAVVESVEVVNSLPLLETQTSSSGQVLEGEYFYKLPNLQHFARGVLYYTPQVQTSNAPYPGSLANWNFNGGFSYQTATFEDGIMSSQMDGGSTLNPVEVGIEEIKVISSAMPAEYGHATSGALVVVKKAGTNTFHGQGGYLFRDDSMVHRRFFELQTLKQQGVQTMFQQPDFVISGPVILPKIYNGRNRTFFQVAGSYHMDSSSNASSFTVPTVAMMNGDYSAYTSQQYDPASTTGTFEQSNFARTPFPNNIIPQSRFSTMWKNISSHNPFKAPQPGVGSVTSTGPLGNIIAAGTGGTSNLTTQFRVDHNWTDKIRTTVSFSKGYEPSHSDNGTLQYAPYDQFQTRTKNVNQAGSVAMTYTITPTLISETKVGFYRRTGNGEPTYGNDYTFELAKTVPNLPSNVYLSPINFGMSQGRNGGTQFGVGTMSVRVNNNHQFNQDFTKVWGKHAFKTGYEWMWMNYINHDISNARLSLNFGDTGGLYGNGTPVSNTGGINLAAIQLGYVSSYSYYQQGASNLPETSNHSLYFQDDWRILPNLTLNLGVRYSNETPAHSKFPGLLSVGSLEVPDNFYTNGSIPGVLRCPAGGCMGGWIHPKGFLWNRDNNNLRPRVGFAWNVTPNTVIRGGFAIMTLDWNIGTWTNNSEIGGSNFYNQSVNKPTNTYASLFQIDQGVPAFVMPTPLADGSIPTFASNPGQRPTITVVPKDFQNARTLNWNFAIQRAVKKDYLVELSYVGMHNLGFGSSWNWNSRPYGTGIDANGNVIDLTKPENWAYRDTWVQNGSAWNGTNAYKVFPNLGGVNINSNASNMIYHSGTVKLEKRYSYGLSFLTFFTFQKGIENQPGNLYQDPNLMRRVAGTTQKFRYVSSMTYELPFGKGKKWMKSSRLLDAVLGGYSFSWNFNVWSSTPMGLGYQGAKVINPNTGKLGNRQDYPGYEPTISSNYRVGTPEIRDNWQDIGTNRFSQTAQNPLVTNCGNTPILQADGSTWGNNCLVVAPSFTIGNMPGNFWREQRIIGANASIYKEFPIKERFKAQFRLDFYNPFKWYNWGNLNSNMDQNNPKTFMTPGLNDFMDSQEGGPPQVHLNFRVTF